MSNLGPNEINNREHISPDTTGDNIAAKKVALYVWDGTSSWARMTQPGGSGGGGTQYQELAVTSPATGTLALGRYKSSLPTLTDGQMNEPVLDSSSRLIVNDTIGNASLSSIVTNTGNGATSANQTNASQKTQVVDGSGNVIGSVSNALKVNTTNGALESGGNLATIVTNTGNSATSANQTNGTQQTKLTDGTNIANVLASGTPNATGSALLTAAMTMPVTFTTTTAQAVASTDAGNYRWVAVQFTSQGTSANVTFQVSNDNTNWSNTALLSSGTSNGAISTSTGATGMFHGPIQGRYFRLNVTGISAGTTAGTVVFSSMPSGVPGMSVHADQNGTWTVGSNSATGSAVPANAFYQGLNDGTNLVGSKDYVAAAATVGLGIQANALVGGLMPIGTKLNTSSYHITTNTTNTPTASTAYVSSVAISAEVGGTTSSVTVQDKSGTPLKLINGLATTAVSTVPTVVNFQTPVLMTGGIDVITAGAVAGTVDVWVNYYQ